MKKSHELTKLQHRIYRETRNAEHPVREIMPWVVERINLEAAWHRIASNDGSNTPGIDGITCIDIEQRLSKWLSALAHDLIESEYKPSQPRWIDVPKKSSFEATRRLGILTIRDRVVHSAIKQVLETIFEPVFLDDSFGFRCGRSVPAALFTATRLLGHKHLQSERYSVGLHLDIADCFDTIDHDLLLGEIAQHIDDVPLTELLSKIIRSGGSMRRGLWTRRWCGLVQGSSLSPLLCNLYLHSIDETLQRLSEVTNQSIRALRYADDILLLARDPRMARRAVSELRKHLAQLKLALRRGSHRPIPVGEGIEWLGVVIKPRTDCWNGMREYCYVVPDRKVREMLETISEMTTLPSTRIDSDAFNLPRWIVSLNEKLRQWHQVYRFADNARAVFHAIDKQVRSGVRELLFHLSGLKGNQLTSAYLQRLPRGFWTWQVEGVRLVNLSSLAPRNPYRLIRKPEWQVAKPVTIDFNRSAAPAESTVSI